MAEEDYDLLRRGYDKEYDWACRKHQKHQNRRYFSIGALIILLFFGFLAPQPISAILFFLAFIALLFLLSPGPPDPNVHPDRYNERQKILQEKREHDRI